MARRTTDKVFNGEKARERREMADLEVKGLVERIARDSGLRYHPDTIRNVELGHTQPSPELSLAWASALNMRLVDLLDDAPEQRAS